MYRYKRFKAKILEFLYSKASAALLYMAAASILVGVSFSILKQYPFLLGNVYDEASSGEREAELIGIALDLARNISTSLGINLFASWVVYVLINRAVKTISGVVETNKRNIRDFMETIKDSRSVEILDIWTDLTKDSLFPRFIEILEFASSRQIPIKILLSNPYSESLEQRSLDLGPVRDAQRNDIRVLAKQGIAKLFDAHISLIKRYEKNCTLEIKLFSTTPSIGLYSWGSRSYFSVYPPDQKSDDSPNLEISNQSMLGQYVKKHFDNLWEVQSSIPIRKHMMISFLLDLDSSQSRDLWDSDRESCYYIGPEQNFNSEDTKASTACVYAVFYDHGIRVSIEKFWERSNHDGNINSGRLRFSADPNVLHEFSRGEHRDGKGTDIFLGKGLRILKSKEVHKRCIQEKYNFSSNSDLYENLSSDVADPTIIMIKDIEPAPFE